MLAFCFLFFACFFFPLLSTQMLLRAAAHAQILTERPRCLHANRVGGDSKGRRSGRGTGLGRVQRCRCESTRSLATIYVVDFLSLSTPMYSYLWQFPGGLFLMASFLTNLLFTCSGAGSTWVGSPKSSPDGVGAQGRGNGNTACRYSKPVVVARIVFRQQASSRLHMNAHVVLLLCSV